MLQSGFIYDMFHNEVMMAPFWAWLIAQVLKTIIYILVNKSFDPERLVGDGGMPSSHSATVMALVTATGINYGAQGFPFALAAILALITMHDAMGVRRETGKQAVVINDMLSLFRDMGKEVSVEDALKEFVGHTPLQVAMGAILGVAMGFLVCSIM